MVSPVYISVCLHLSVCISVQLSACRPVALSVCLSVCLSRICVSVSRLPCSFLALALLGSYAVQSDLGDYDTSQQGSGCEYIQDIKFAPRQGEELLDKIAELHKTHRYVHLAQGTPHARYTQQ